MSTLNAQIFLNTFSDSVSSNAPSLNNVRWCRDLINIAVSNAQSQNLGVPQGQSVSLVNQSVPKRLVYIECDQEVTLTIGSETVVISPIITGTNILPAIYLSTNHTLVMSVMNNGSVDANLFIISAE